MRSVVLPLPSVPERTIARGGSESGALLLERAGTWEKVDITTWTFDACPNIGREVFICNRVAHGKGPW